MVKSNKVIMFDVSPERQVGLGVDIVDIQRFVNVLDRTQSFTERVFFPDEIAYCNSKANPSVHFATHFAAKEAILKALGVGFFQKSGLKSVEILHNRYGRPYVVLHSKLVDVAKDLEVSDIPVSLSFTHSEAVACAIALKAASEKKSEENLNPTFTTTDEINVKFKEIRKMLD